MWWNSNIALLKSARVFSLSILVEDYLLEECLTFLQLSEKIWLKLKNIKRLMLDEYNLICLGED